MLDVREYDHQIQDSAQSAALAVVTDTTARAIEAVIDGRRDQLGRRTMLAVRELLDTFNALREQAAIVPKESAGGEVFKNRDITSGVGSLIGEEQSSAVGSRRWSDLLDLSTAVSVEGGRLLVKDITKGRRLADLLRDMANFLTNRSAQTYAETQTSYRE